MTNQNVSLKFAVSRVEKSLVDPNKPLRVFGWGSVSKDATGNLIVDHQNDSINPDELERAAYLFVREFGSANAEHTGPEIGRVIESVYFDVEKRLAMGIPTDNDQSVKWWVGFEINDMDTKRRFAAGEFAELSIEGAAVREEV